MAIKIPDNLPESVKQALAVFTEQELSELYAAFSFSNEFLGIGFTYDGKYTKYAEPEKAAAVLVLEEQYRTELSRMDCELRQLCIETDLKRERRN